MTHQRDRSMLLQHILPERHDALRNFLGDAPTFNVVFFKKVYDCRGLANLNLSTLVAKVPGLQEPPSLNGPGFLTISREVRNAVFNFLQGSGCPVRTPEDSQLRAASHRGVEQPADDHGAHVSNMLAKTPRIGPGRRVSTIETRPDAESAHKSDVSQPVMSEGSVAPLPQAFRTCASPQGCAKILCDDCYPP